MKFGQLKDMDLREVWPYEANNFAPWLAENLSHLAEAIGIPLELEGTEISMFRVIRACGVKKILNSMDLIPVHDALSLEWVLCRVDNPRPITSRVKGYPLKYSSPRQAASRESCWPTRSRAWTGGRDAPVSRAMPHARLLERRWSRSVCSWSDGMKPEVRS